MPEIITPYGTWDVPAQWDANNGYGFRAIDSVDGTSIVRFYAPAYALVLMAQAAADGSDGDATAAEAARVAAVAAQGLAEAARDTSVSAAGDAEGFRDEAAASETNAAASALAAATAAASYRPDVTIRAGIPPIIDVLLTDTAGIPPALVFARAGAGTYYDAFGTLVSAAATLPRLIFNPATGECLGYLSEPGRTNLFTYSEDFRNTADAGEARPWVYEGTTITPNDAVAPDETTTMDKLVEDSSTGAHRIYRVQSVTAGTAYSETLFSRADERSVFDIIFGSSGFGANVTAKFDLTAGTATIIIPGTAASASIRYVGDGIYRCRLTAQATASASPQISKRLNIGAADTYAGDGVSGLHIWGAQFEVGSYASSYTATVASAVARSADTSAQTVTDDWNAVEGTIYVEGFTAAGLGTGSQVAIQYDDGTEDERVRVERDSSGNVRAIVTAAGVEQCNLDLGVVANDTEIRIAFSFTANSFTARLNGGAEVTDTVGTMPTGIDTKRIGRDTTGNQWGGTIRRDTLFAHKIDTATLLSITQG